VSKTLKSGNPVPDAVRFTHRIRTFADIDKLGDRVGERVVATWLTQLLAGKGGLFSVTISALPADHTDTKKKR